MASGDIDLRTPCDHRNKLLGDDKNKQKLATWLSTIHIVLTFGGSLMLWILPKFYSVDAFAYAYNNLTIAITLSALVMLIGQILFPINIVYGLLKNRTGR